MFDTNRSVRLVALLTVMVLAVTACSGQNTTPTEGSDTATSAAPEGSDSTTSTSDNGNVPSDAEEGGTLRIALFTEPQHLNAGITTGPDMGIVTRRTIFEALLTTDRNVELVGVLAESWEVSDDATQYTFHLREGVTWHDGEPFTSDDVVFSFEEVSALHPSGAQLIEQISSIDTPDDSTVILTLTEPYAPLLVSLISENMVILPRHIYSGGDIFENPANLEPIGTGPFKFEEWTAGSEIVLVRNDDYWGDRPAMSRLVYAFIPEPITQINAIRNAEIDYISRWHIDRALIDQLIGAPGIEVDEGVRATPTQMILWFNNDNAPLDRPEVRKALFQAIDRETIIASAFGGHATLMKSAIPEFWEWAYDPSVDYGELYPYDPDAAAAALEAAGLHADSSGTRFELTFLYSDGAAGSGAFAEIVRSNLADVGVDVNLVQREYNVMGEELYLNRNYDLSVIGHASRADPVLGVHRNYECVDVRSAQFTNPTGYCNEDLDELLTQAKVARSDDERTEIYSQMQHILSEDLPAVSVATLDYFDVIREGFGGLEEFFNTTEIYMNYTAIYRDE